MYKLGIDLGGTNIAVGVVDEKFNIVGKASVKTGLPCSAESIVEKIVTASLQAVENAVNAQVEELRRKAFVMLWNRK